MNVRTRLGRCARAIARRLGSVEHVTVPVLEGSLLEGRHALVTGGTSGIGYAIAASFLDNGADVVVTGRDRKRLDDAVARLSDADRAHAYGIVLDNADSTAIPDNVDEVCGLLGRAPDILVNNAGVNDFGGFGSIDPDGFDRVMAVNLRGVALLSQEVARRMIDAQERGSILNIASSSSLRPAVSAYTMSKWGLRGLTLGMAKSLAPHGITVNALAPGPTATPMLLPDGSEDISRPQSPVGRYALPEEIANMAVVLVSDMGRMVVGDTVFMTGGSGLITFDDAGSYECNFGESSGNIVL